MKSIKITLFLILNVTVLFGQMPFQEIVSVDGEITNMGIYNGDLVFTDGDRLLKATLDGNNYPVSTVLSSFNVSLMKPYGDYIYFTVFNTLDFVWELRKIIPGSNSSNVGYDIGDAYISEMEIDGVNIYYGSFFSLVRNKLDDSFASPTTVSGSSWEVYGVERYQGAIYFSNLDFTNGPVIDGPGTIYKENLYDSKIDPEVLIDNVGWVSGIAIHNNFLYFIKRTSLANPGVNNRICRIQLSDPSYEIEELSEEFKSGQEARLIIHEGIIYFSNGRAGEESGKIFKLENALNTQDILSEVKISLYPNPTKKTISISGLKDVTNYEIFSVTGAKIKKGVCSSSQGINVENLSTGLYYIKLEAIAQSLKFIKE